MDEAAPPCIDAIRNDVDCKTQGVAMDEAEIEQRLTALEQRFDSLKVLVDTLIELIKKNLYTV